MNLYEIYSRISTLKKAKDAIILAHNYQSIEIQQIADMVGDSFQLAKVASEIQSSMIVFCGVKFMTETAKLLNPDARVLLSNNDAGCPMADMVKVEDLQLFKKKNPHHLVVCYVNSSVEVKALSDVCVTSSNAVQIVKKLPINVPILFVPDRNLGHYVKIMTGRKIDLWDGYCPVHQENITINDLINARGKYPTHKIAVHPECEPKVVEKADFIGSTKQLIDYTDKHENVIIGTETSLTKMLQKKYPQKSIISLSDKATCIDMQRTNVLNVLETLENESNETIIPDNISTKALNAITKMLEFN